MLFRVSFRVKLVLIFISLLIVSILAIAFFSVYSSRSAIEHDQKIALSEITNLVTTNVTRTISSINSLIHDFSENESVQSFFVQPEFSDRKEICTASKSLLRPFLYTCKVFLVKGKQVFLPLENENTDLNPLRFQDLAQHAMQRSAQIVWDSSAQSLLPDGGADSARCLRVTKRIQDSATGKELGYFVLELSPREFLPLLLSNQASLSNQYHLIFDRNMEIITANRSFDTYSNDRILSSLQKHEETVRLGKPLKQCFIKQQYEGLTGWTVVCIQPASAAFPSGSELIRLVAQFTVMICLLTSFIIILITSTVTHPIHAISKAMKTFEDGDFSVRVHPRGSDEMGQLMRSFNYMADEIDRLIHEVYLAQIAYKEAKLSALQAQINPHFLYNTLDSMQWLLLSHGEMEVASVIVALGDIFRYSTNAEEQFVRLEQEVSFLHDYLKIQKFRLEDNLQICWKIPENLLCLYIPRLILQPLIENAIKYGAGADGKICIEIKTRASKGNLEIAVTDHGKGLGEALRSDIQKIVESPDAPAEKFGLRNVHKRLQLLFGKKAGIHFCSEENTSSTFSIVLPLLTEIPQYEGKERV